MPNDLFGLDVGFPAFTGQESTEQKVKVIQNYLYMLLEQLKYALRNLGKENFNPTALQELEDLFSDEFIEEINAGTVITNTLITNELYADYGEIADLTVWRLRTDYARARKFLNGDTGRLDYIYIHDEQIDFISATTDGTDYKQLKVDGKKFYWRDGTKTQMTNQTVTIWPVYVYVYDEPELVKASIRFDTVDGVALPVISLGAGDENGNSKGTIYKATDGLYINYLTSGAAEIGVKLTDAGFVDIVKQRRPTGYDFSTIGSGYFTETIDGGGTTRYDVTVNASGYITKITDPDGHETVVTW